MLSLFLYILAINNSFMNVVYIYVHNVYVCIYVKIKVLDYNYSITMHMLGKLEEHSQRELSMEIESEL